MWIVKLIDPLDETQIIWECIGETVSSIMNDYRESNPNGKWLNESIIRNSYSGRNYKDRHLIHVQKN